MRRLALIAIPLLICAPASAQVQLTYKFSPGQVIRQKVTQVMTSAAEYQGQKLDTSINQTMFIDQTVESVEPDGSAKVRQKISRIQMSVKAPLGQGFEYDSADEDSAEGLPAAGKVLQQLAGVEFQARILPTGKLVDIKVPEEVAKVFQGIPGSPFGDGGEDAIKQMIGQSTTPFPEKSLTPGESWSDDRPVMKMPFGEMKVNYTNTYEGTNDDGLHVIKMDLGMELIPAENQPIKMTFKDADAKGTMLFDNSVGQMARSDLTQNMVLDATVMGQSFEQKIKQNVTIERLPDSTGGEKAE